MIAGSSFHDLGWPLNYRILMTFASLEIGLKLDGFQGHSGVTPPATILLGCKLVGSWARATPIPGSLTRSKKSWDRDWEYWDWGESTYDTWHNGNGTTMDASQPAGPSQGGAARYSSQFSRVYLKGYALCRRPFSSHCNCPEQTGQMVARNQIFEDLGWFRDPIWKLF